MHLIIKTKSILIFIFLIVIKNLSAQNTFSPYSRYGIGELNTTLPAHNLSMGGAFTALKPDSFLPVFINTGNPASYALIRFTTLEVGGTNFVTQYQTQTASPTKWSTNFSYANLGFPVRNKSGICFGLAPFSNVGYNYISTSNLDNVGTINYNYSGSGGLNKVYAGFGTMPFKNALIKFRRKRLYIPDSLKKLSHFSYTLKENLNKILSDFSIGTNLVYLFGDITNGVQITYPNSTLYTNVARVRDFTTGDFTGNFGLQTAITVDSVKTKNKNGTTHKRAMREKIKITFGFFSSINNTLNSSYSSIAYNYNLNAYGNPTIKDTVFYNPSQSGLIKLPLEQSFGIGFKKGERINAVADFGITSWQNFKFFETVSSYKNNYRYAIGVNYVPNKYASGSGAYIKRINYRLGANYNTGFLEINNSNISSYNITAGVGLPVGIGRMPGMVNLGMQYGQLGSTNNNLVRENQLRFFIGFTFSDKWFQKFKYD
ncbi:MAG: hypothetical protein JSU07_12875 [Bacteroidetes bacterium]|nr:hypothetical protein [Bacteroidota bacterium]